LPTKNYSVAVMSNLTSQDASAVYGVAITEALLQKILEKDVQFNIYLKPFPANI
jgi:hypothetical protein